MSIQNTIAGTAGVGAGIAFVVAILCILPALFLWSINSLAELGGLAFYVDHTIWNYWVSLIFLACIRGGK